MMCENEARYWGTILSRCKLLKHPSKLSARDRQLQYMILSAASYYTDKLPQRPRWEKWFLWTLEQVEK